MSTKKPRKLIILMFALVLAILVLSACSSANTATGNYAQIPVGKAYAEGLEVYFSHTEASDAGIAETLSNMMQSPVLFVPALGQIPAELVAEVYVFENGVVGDGPLGFQVDVFNAPPPSEEYTPLRQILFVNWISAENAVALKSEAEILAAEEAGKITISESGVVVNMPFMVWDGGKR